MYCILLLQNGLTVTNTNADENGNFQGVSTNIPGISYSYSYTENGRLKSETNPSGLTTTYQYQNGDGYLNRISSPFETENFNEYDDVGNLLHYSNSRGITSTYTVNQFAEVTSETASAEGSMSPLNFNASYSYFKNGNLQSQDTIFGTGDGAVQNSSNYTYDSRDNLLTETESARGTTTYTYDGNDNITNISSGIDYMSFNYDDRDMPSTFFSGQGANAGAYSFTYDGNRNMVTSTDPYGHVTSYQHDGYDRVKTITDPLGNASIISRAEFGNLLTIKNIASSGEVLRETARVNDPLGRMTQYSVKVPGGTDEIYNYTYADGGKTVTITDSLNRLWTVKKNDFGQVYEETNPAGNKTEYFYLDGRGNMTKKIETEKRPDGTAETHTTEYRYNAFNKTEEIKENVGTPAEAVTTLTYDCQGNLDGSIDGEGNTISHKYDSLGTKIRTKKHFKDGTAVTTDFTYYANNLLKTIKDSKGNTTAYEYDNQKRLTKIIYPDNSSSQYTYTTASVDNKVYRSVVEKQRNGTVVTSLFDELNRLKSRNISPSQGVDGVTNETYEYDALSRLTRAVGDDFTVDRKYDSLNRVARKSRWGI